MATAPLRPEQIAAATLPPGWVVEPGPRLALTVDHADYARIAQALAQMADAADHHPDVDPSGPRTTIRWWTHDTGGLHALDLTMAARTTALLRGD